MEPFKAKKLPIEYNLDKELFVLLSEASKKYGEYKAKIADMEYEAGLFLNSLLLTESFKSTQIEGTSVSQDDMFFARYERNNDDNREIINLKNAVEYGYDKLKSGGIIDYSLVNEMHKIILDSVRGESRSPGKIRDIQNWIAPKGVGIENATFIPPAPEEIYGLLQNLYEYMNDAYVDPTLVNIAISHAQFETIHAYRDGNGRIGRALIPLQAAGFDNTQPILFLSEIFELYRPSYQRYLMAYRYGSVTSYLCFFLQCVIEQCNSYIYKLHQVETIYKEDMEKISSFRGESIYKIMPVIMKLVVFTKKEVQTESGVSVNVVSNNINRLFDIGILEKDTSVLKKGYKYRRIYDVFVT
ncbi:MAG: Fic family protein [Eubacterium sp.]|nr:Fic family protein [Eubacterium sp.]